ncbi:hypothetical protein HGRIS_012801 [Hohenbuehelia grisea]|uniref:Uncharacterized protein n=1 Tax=Hohenbuehelia grisea TaxID=104357 RepID=A0ABR3ITG1_9AGAR
MFHDLKSVGLSPAKGKAKEDNSWYAGWWEFEYLLENARRPVEWSTSSIIFTAHPTEASIIGRHFSSSKQFSLPAPARHPAGPFDPPTVISVSSVPDQEEIFAYFPGRETEGLACIWQRTIYLDEWRVVDTWQVERGAGIVAASWLAMPREWCSNEETGTSSRLPPRGPPLPPWASTIMLVTQNNHVEIRYHRKQAAQFKTLSVPLSQPGRATENHAETPKDNGPPLGGMTICTHAAIGLPYQENSILVATRSHRYPLASATDPGTTNFDLSEHAPPVVNIGHDRSIWGEQGSIELAEIRLVFNGVVMSIVAMPLPPLSYPTQGLSQLSFVPLLPSTPPAAPISPSQGGQPATLLLTANSLDFGDYTTTPVSELRLWKYSRQKAGPGWKLEHQVERRFSTSVLAFTLPQAARSGATDIGIYAAILDTYGTAGLRKPRPKQAAIGTISVLNLNDLSDDNHWERCAIRQPINRLGRELPLNGVISPNGTRLCTVSLGLHPATTTIHALPKWENASAMQLDTPSRRISQVPFVTAVLARRSTTDLADALASLPLDDIVSTLYDVYQTLEGYMKGLNLPVLVEILGISVEVYRRRARTTGDDTEREQAAERWQLAQDISSLIASNRNFNACNEGDLYDLSSVWQLIGISTWVIDLSEKVMKECVLCWDGGSTQRQPDPGNEGDDLFGSRPNSPSQGGPLTSSPLLFLAHPLVLLHLRDAIRHVKGFHKHLSSLAARGDNALIARDVLQDLFTTSGIDLHAFDLLLDDLLADASALQGEELRRSIAACTPTPALSGFLRATILKVMESNALHKARLFLKPADLVDDLARLSFGGPKKNKDRSILTKGVLPRNDPDVGSCGTNPIVGKCAKPTGIVGVSALEAGRRLLCKGVMVGVHI